MWASEESGRLSFSVSGYNYSVFATFGKGVDESGVYVERDGKAVLNQRCGKHWSTNLGAGFHKNLVEAGVQVDDSQK
jgi:hypothetical protein